MDRERAVLLPDSCELGSDMTPEWHDRWDEGAVIAYQDLGITDIKADCCAVLGIDKPEEASVEALDFWVYDCWKRRRNARD